MNQSSNLKIDQIVPKWSVMLDKIVEKSKNRTKFWTITKRFATWYDEQRKLLGEPHMDIGNGCTCIVGEFWGFGNFKEEPLYWNLCRICERHSYNFMELYSSVLDGEIKDWRKDKRIINFLKHVEKRHPERLIMLGELNK